MWRQLPPWSWLLAAGITFALNHARLDWGHLAVYVGFVVLAVACLHELPAAAIVACVLATLNGQVWYAANCRQTYSIERRDLLLSQGGRALTVLVAGGDCVFRGNRKAPGFDRAPTRADRLWARSGSRNAPDRSAPATGPGCQFRSPPVQCAIDAGGPVDLGGRKGFRPTAASLCTTRPTRPTIFWCDNC